MREAVDWVTHEVVRAVAHDEPVPHAAIALLLRQYAVSGRADLAGVLEAALTRALQEAAERLDAAGGGSESDLDAAAASLSLCAEAAAVSDDPRLRDLAAALGDTLLHAWPARGAVDRAMRMVDACFVAAPLLSAPELIAAAIDELERIVAVAYEPGEGLGPTLDTRAVLAPRAPDQVAGAAALLSAFDVTARLPYAMLAEELMRVASTLSPEPGTFLFHSARARVLVRLARLHADAEYCRAAVVAPASDYLRDARATLEPLAGSYRQYGTAAALFAIAVAECFDLQ